MRSRASRAEALAWALTDKATQDAYRRSTGEDIAPALIRYRKWLEENIIGPPSFPTDCRGQNHGV